MLALVVGVAAFFYELPSPGDDTFIYMRYVGNAIAGHGFVYNIGEQSFGVTSPVWAYIMLPIAMVFGNSLLTWTVASSVCFGLRTWLTYVLADELTNHKTVVACLVTLAAALEPYTFRWCATGMENSLYMLVLAVLGWLFFTNVGTLQCSVPTTRIKSVLFGAVLGATPFVRPELSIVGGILALFLLLKARDQIAISDFFIAAFASFAVLAAITVCCFGGILPSTAQAKALLLPAGPRGLFDAGIQFSLVMLATGAGGMLAPLLAIRPEGIKSLAWKTANIAAIVIVIAYLGWANQMMTTRYASQISGVATFAAAVLIAWQVGVRGNLAKWMAACCVLQLMLAGAVLAFMFPSTQINQVPYIKEFADFMQTNSPRDARIALSEIGMFGYYLDRYLIDTIGLVDPATVDWAKKNGRPVADQLHLDRYLIARKATYYIDTSGQGPPIQGQELSYELIKRGTIPRTREADKFTGSEWRLYRLSAIAPGT